MAYGRGLYHNNIMKHGKKYTAVAEKREAQKEYTLAEAIAFLQENKTAKFDESLEVHVNLGINPRKTDEMVRERLFCQTVLGVLKKWL